MYDIILFTTTLFVGLCVGIFFAFVVAINGALGKLSDEMYLRAMQSINRVILNPLFMLVFMGPVLLLPVAAYLAHTASSDDFMLLIVASGLYIIGMFGITAVGNVPLNERLDKIALGRQSSGDMRAARTMYEKPWNRLHAIRTLAGIGSFAVLLYVLIK